MSTVAVPRPARPARPPLRVMASPPPHGRLGVAWTAVTVGAIAGGRWSLAAWLGVVGFVAAAGAVRAIPVLDRPRLWSAALGAVAIPLAAAAGPLAFSVAVAAAGAAAVLANRPAAGDGLRGLLRAGPVEAGWVRLRPMAMAVMVSVGLGVGGAGVVLLRQRSLTSVALLLALVCCHDASRYLVGWGAPAPWEGVAAGVASVGAATLGVAVIQPSPVTGWLVWVLGAVVALGGVAGPAVSDLVAPGRPAPGLRRVDSLVVTAPLWLVVSVLAGH